MPISRDHDIIRVKRTGQRALKAFVMLEQIQLRQGQMVGQWIDRAVCGQQRPKHIQQQAAGDRDGEPEVERTHIEPVTAQIPLQTTDKTDKLFPPNYNCGGQ